ncbi:hypothetical protein JDV02_008758 [Purpureocillium takamizusanense]|uniref:Cell cycle control protein n=1 Tax=Purpureocillium takamizusanense TaxID=2060973 RepID=A0A9Q8QKU2_9HYPO|nr:uncharacterized protein JDV02_008758 [Purpureocillium takamizusanense]UNI22914.1 hypothetical protein JDV02_008758 [Purpureocillium takamizusanense]
MMARPGDGGSLFVDDDDLDIIEITNPNSATQIASLLNPLRPVTPAEILSSRRSDRSRDSSRWDEPPPARRSTRWDRPPPPPLPRSQAPTVIDLTNEPDSPVQERRLPPPAPSLPGRNPRRTNSQRPSPPRLSRSDSTFVGPGAVIDLTDDSPREGRRLEPPRPFRARNSHRHGRQHQRGSVADHHDHDHDHDPHLSTIHLQFVDNATPNNLLTTFRSGVRHMVDTLFSAELLRSGYNPTTIDSLSAFTTREPSPKPPMEDVPPTRPGFTRDTCAATEDTEERVVVCPACEEELAYDPTETAAESATTTAGKKRKRVPGEHHFWALKKCGHVYCADCFENRRPTKASQGVGFRNYGTKQGSSTGSDLKCAVPGCETKAANKTEWIGIFL